MPEITEEIRQLKEQMIKNNKQLIEQITKNYKELERCIQNHLGK